MKNSNEKSFNQKRLQKISVNLAYKPSNEVSFRLYKALSMLISEDDIRNHLKASNLKTKQVK